MVFAHLSVWEKLSPAPTFFQTLQIPCTPQVPFMLLPWCWSAEGVSLSESMCRLFKGNCLGLKFSSTDSVPAGFCSQKLWGLIFLAQEPWTGGPCEEVELLSSEISLPNFYLPHMDERPARSASLPSYQSRWM